MKVSKLCEQKCLMLGNKRCFLKYLFHMSKPYHKKHSHKLNKLCQRKYLIGKNKLMLKKYLTELSKQTSWKYLFPRSK